MMKRAGHVACMGDKSSASKVAVGKLKEGDHLEDVSIDDGVILQQNLKKYDRIA